MKKIELHLHLDGSIRPSTLSELTNISLEDAKTNLIAPDKCIDLNDYLMRFGKPVSIMQTRKNLERVSYELACDLINDEVIYAEIRFAPNKHTEILSLNEVIDSVLKGLRRTNLKCNLILCMMRGDSYEDNKNIIDLAKSYLGKGVCAIDLAGAEAIFKTEDYRSLFEYAKSLNVLFTIHAGEADGIDSINSALSFGTKRLGHGIRSIEDKDTLNNIIKNNILLEVCPTSNVQTNVVDKIDNHPVRYLLDSNVKICINTDNRTVSNVTLEDEYYKLKNYLNVTNEELISMNINAIEGSFLNDEEKQALINEIRK